MSIYVLILVAVFCFAFTCFFRKWRDKDILILIAIGCAINANIFNSNTVPVEVGNLVFGIDSIIYTLFVFTVIIEARDYGIKDAKSMTTITIAAIMISATIEFFAYWSFSGINTQILISLGLYVISAFGTFVAIWAMLWLFQTLKKKNVNRFVNIALCILIASIINSFIYFGGAFMIGAGTSSNFVGALIGSYIGKIFCIFLALVVYFINTTFWIPKGLEKKYCKKSKTQIQSANNENIECK